MKSVKIFLYLSLITIPTIQYGAFSKTITAEIEIQASPEKQKDYDYDDDREEKDRVKKLKHHHPKKIGTDTFDDNCDFPISDEQKTRIERDLAYFNQLPIDQKIMVNNELTEEYKYACLLCLWASSTKQSVFDHAETIHTDTPEKTKYPCKKCHICFFKNQASVTMHQKNQCSGFLYPTETNSIHEKKAIQEQAKK